VPLIVVTGATGYVGGRLVAHLAGAGAKVRSVGREPAADWLLPLAAGGHFALDLATDALDGICDGADAVIHLAGPNEVAAAADPDAALAVTATATRRVAAAASAAGVPRLVYGSTVHVYGAAMTPGATVSEDTLPEPRHPYAIARLAAEHIAAAAGPPLVVLRMTNTVGAPMAASVDRWSLLVNDLCRQAVTTGEVALQSAGDQWRDFVPLVGAVRVLAASAMGDGPPPGTYNLGSGRPVTVRDMAEMVQGAIEARTGHRPPLRAPAPTGPPPAPYRVSVGRLAACGWTLDEDIRAAVDEAAAFCVDHQDELDT
jgi:UDP-glucose 4-epimerase